MVALGSLDSNEALGMIGLSTLDNGGDGPLAPSYGLIEPHL